MKAKAKESLTTRKISKGVVTFSRKGGHPQRLEQKVDFKTVRHTRKDSQTSAEPSGVSLEGGPNDPYEFQTSDDDEPVKLHQHSGRLRIKVLHPTYGRPPSPLPLPFATMKQDAAL